MLKARTRAMLQGEADPEVVAIKKVLHNLNEYNETKMARAD